MRTSGRSSTVTLILALLASLALAAACSPASGPLGTPSSPPPTGNASAVPPSGDATPEPASTPTEPPSTPPSPSSITSPTPFATPTPATTPTAAPSGTMVVRAYFMLGSFTGNAGLVPVLREIPATTGVAAAAIRQLIAGPSAKELAASPALSTSVPASTKLLGLKIANGTAVVNLSEEYMSGSIGSVIDARDAQVIYTLTQFSTVKNVMIQIDGQGGGNPTGRDFFRNAFLPAIFVDRPAWGAAAGNPAKVSGVANVFEATFRVQLKDANGKVLADKQVMASCGTGCWGAFSTTVSYTVAKAQWGTLRVYDLSAKDGTPENVTEYPVWLTPAG